MDALLFFSPVYFTVRSFLLTFFTCSNLFFLVECMCEHFISHISTWHPRHHGLIVHVVVSGSASVGCFVSWQWVQIPSKNLDDSLCSGTVLLVVACLAEDCHPLLWQPHCLWLSNLRLGWVSPQNPGGIHASPSLWLSQSPPLRQSFWPLVVFSSGIFLHILNN